MAGFPRRSKPLKARSSLEDLTDLVLTSPQDGDLIVYESSSAIWQNSKALTGNYTVAGDWHTTTLTTDGLATLNSLSVTNNALIGGNLTVTGTATLGNLAIVDLTVSGNATFAGTVSIAGTLTGAGFSFSGAGTVAGALTLASTLSVTGATTLSSTLSVTGAITAASAALTGNLFVGGNEVVTGTLAVGGAIAGASLGITGSAQVLGTLTLGNGAVYTDNGVTFFDDGTAVQFLNGTVTILSLDSASIIEGTGAPTNALAYVAGSLYLQTDGSRDATLWVRGPGGWFPVKDSRDDLDFLLTDWAESQEYILTGSIEAGDATFSTERTGQMIASALPWYIMAEGNPAFGIVRHPSNGLQTSMYGQATGAAGAQIPGTAKKFTVTPFGGRYLGRSVADGTGSDDVLLEFYDSTETTRFGSFWFKHKVGAEQFQIQSQIDDAVLTIFGSTGGVSGKALFYASPTAETRLYYGGTLAARTNLYTANGFASTLGMIEYTGNNYRAVGYAGYGGAVFQNATYTLARSDLGGVVEHSGATPHTWTTPDSTDTTCPDMDSVWTLMNFGSGVVTVAAGAGVTLYWLDGSALATGSRNIALGGWCKIWRRDATSYFLNGTGIT